MDYHPCLREGTQISLLRNARECTFQKMKECVSSNMYVFRMHYKPPLHSTLTKLRNLPNLSKDEKESYDQELSREEMITVAVLGELQGQPIIYRHKGDENTFLPINMKTSRPTEDGKNYEIIESKPARFQKAGEAVVAYQFSDGTTDVGIRLFNNEAGYQVCKDIECGFALGSSIQHARVGPAITIREYSICRKGRRPGTGYLATIRLQTNIPMTISSGDYIHPPTNYSVPPDILNFLNLSSINNFSESTNYKSDTEIISSSHYSPIFSSPSSSIRLVNTTAKKKMTDLSRATLQFGGINTNNPPATNATNGAVGGVGTPQTSGGGGTTSGTPAAAAAGVGQTAPIVSLASGDQTSTQNAAAAAATGATTTGTGAAAAAGTIPATHQSQPLTQQQPLAGGVAGQPHFTTILSKASDEGHLMNEYHSLRADIDNFRSLPIPKVSELITRVQTIVDDRLRSGTFLQPDEETRVVELTRAVGDMQKYRAERNAQEVQEKITLLEDKLKKSEEERTTLEKTNNYNVAMFVDHIQDLCGFSQGDCMPEEEKQKFREVKEKISNGGISVPDMTQRLIPCVSRASANCHAMRVERNLKRSRTETVDAAAAAAAMPPPNLQNTQNPATLAPPVQPPVLSMASAQQYQNQVALQQQQQQQKQQQLRLMTEFQKFQVWNETIDQYSRLNSRLDTMKYQTQPPQQAVTAKMSADEDRTTKRQRTDDIQTKTEPQTTGANSSPPPATITTPAVYEDPDTASSHNNMTAAAAAAALLNNTYQAPPIVSMASGESSNTGERVRPGSTTAFILAQRNQMLTHSIPQHLREQARFNAATFEEPDRNELHQYMKYGNMFERGHSRF
jgi:hypothetical protein